MTAGIGKEGIYGPPGEEKVGCLTGSFCAVEEEAVEFGTADDGMLVGDDGDL